MMRAEAIVSVGITASRQHPDGAYLAINDEIEKYIPLQEAARKHGAELVYHEMIPSHIPENFDYTARCRIAKERNVGWISLNIFPPGPLKFPESCAKIGYRPTWVNVGGLPRSPYNPVLEGMRGLLTNPPVDSQIPAVKEFREAVATYDPELAEQPYFGGLSLDAWTAFQLLAKAIETAHPEGADVTRADVYRGLYGLKRETLGGLAPPLTFHRGKATSINCYLMAQLKDGKTVVTSDGYVCFDGKELPKPRLWSSAVVRDSAFAAEEEIAKRGGGPKELEQFWSKIKP
jgi:hypothetical protein